MLEERTKLNKTFNHYLIKYRWFPYSVLAVSSLFLLYFARNDFGKPIGILILATLAFASLVIFRQFVIIRENIRLFREQAIRQSEQRFHSLVQNSFDIVFIFDFRGMILFQSPSVERLLGYKHEELKGKNGLDFVHPDDIKEVKRLTSMIIEERSLEILSECRFRHKDGSWRILEGIGTLFIDEPRGINGFLLNSRDITQRKLYEKSLRSYARRLKRSNTELQDFAFIASHDLQEPLRKIQAFSDRLKTKHSLNLGEDGVDYLMRMQKASVRMQILINDLLSFSRITTKAKPFKNVDLKIIVEDVLSDLELKIEETGAKIIVEYLPEIDADETQMSQLFQNLIGNALKFQRPDKTPLIKIYTEENTEGKIDPMNMSFEPDSENRDVPKGFCRIYVEDNGIGFDEKYGDRIFKVFQRLHGNNSYEGSGIGLAICRKIVEHHNGNISAKSIPNSGAKFIITLPLQQHKEEEDE